MPIAAAVGQLSMPDLPLFLIAGCPNPFNPGQAESFYTTDPGKALVTGQCSDFNRIKGPVLRSLAARAPYFHNGSAASLLRVVNFYNERLHMQLSATQKCQLVAFLSTLRWRRSDRAAAHAWPVEAGGARSDRDECGR